MRIKTLDYKKQSFSIIVFAGLVTVTAVYWDSWWHLTIGRETFWTPPHTAIYSGLVIAIIGFSTRFVNDLRNGERLPSGYFYFIIGIILIMVAAPLDNLWHERFGLEHGGSLLTIWAPPHIIGLAGGVISSIGFLHTLVNEAVAWKNALSTILIATQFGLLISAITFALMPLEPITDRNFLGIWGVPIIIFPSMLLRFASLYVLRRTGVLTLVTMVNWLHLVIVAGILFANFTLLAFAVWMLPAVLVDTIVHFVGKGAYSKQGLASLSLLYGFILSVAFYQLANNLALNYGNLGYSLFETGIMTILILATSAVAGYLAPTFSGLFVSSLGKVQVQRS